MSVHRSYWLPRHVWLGARATLAPGPIYVFPSERLAREWAAEAPDSIGAVTERRIWRVTIRPDVHVYRVTKIPATTSMEVELR